MWHRFELVCLLVFESWREGLQDPRILLTFGLIEGVRRCHHFQETVEHMLGIFSERKLSNKALSALLNFDRIVDY